ncbi:hypothetical protein Ddye_006044 [Dipteronia dyeriana]|uniref:Uncharacterized protein n=1 Tax=Dipteronia dyeriana TaxID=168575 RepID=A0AAD9XHU6_9ROSI|nr:hypothetical protein Ddye_006044 [Dipteronia dyeriana]
MRSFVTEPKDTIPFIRLLLPGIEKLIEDKTPEGLNVVATLGSLISEMGEESFSDLDSWLLDTLQSDYSNVERSGAAQGLSEEIGSTSVHSVATTPNQPESDDRSLQTSERSTLNPFSMADLFHEGQAVIERYISNPFIIPDLLLEGRMRVPTEGYIKRCREGRHGMVWANVPCQHMVWCDSCKNEAVEAIGSIHGHTCQICGRNVEGICRRPM